MHTLNSCLVARRRHRLTRSLAAIAVLPGTLLAQTFVVDASNGPGTDFTDLPEAVAAVPSGATLHVLPGSYSAFQVANKSLRIVGHGAAVVGSAVEIRGTLTQPRVVVGPLAPTDAVTFSSFQLRSGPGTPGFDIADCDGPVVIDEIDLFLFYPDGINSATVRNSTNVHIHDLSTVSNNIVIGTITEPTLTIDGSIVELSRSAVAGHNTSTGAGLPALQIDHGSRVVVVDSSLVGGNANASVFSGSIGGAPAVVVQGGSTLHLFGNAASGSTPACSGGSGAGVLVPPGPGGDGLVLSRGSFARVHGVALRGGTGNPNGQPFVVDATSSLDYDAAAVTPSGVFAGHAKPGTTLTYQLFAKPGSAAGLLVGVDSQLTMLPVLHLGALGVQPFASVFVGTVPASGTTDLASHVPLTWPDDTVVLAQWLVFDPTTSHIDASNVFMAASRF